VNIIAIDTATTACAIGLATNDTVLTRVLDAERHHTETLATGIAALLTECGLTPRDLDLVVVDYGPGLYTGLRVGVITATSLAQAVGCSLVGVTSLETLAWGAHDAGVRGELVCAVDARRGELFVQDFYLSDDHLATTEPRVATPDDVVAQQGDETGTFTFTGDGALRYHDAFAALATAHFFDQSVPSLRAALRLGATREPVTSLAPLYLREADAIANFATRGRST